MFMKILFRKLANCFLEPSIFNSITVTFVKIEDVKF